MGKDVWRVEFDEPAEPSGRARRFFGEDEKSARSWAERLGGTLFRREEPGDDDGVLSMSNPSAYDWKEVPR